MAFNQQFALEAREALPTALTKRTIRWQLLWGPSRSSSVQARFQWQAAERSSTTRLAFGGTGGWIGGALAGGAVGYLLVDRGGTTSWVPVGTPIGGWLGAAVGAPLGVHVANRGRGNYLLSALASTGIGIGGAAISLYGAAATVPELVFVGLAGTIIAQIWASIAVERATASR